MSIIQVLRPSSEPTVLATPKRQWWRFAALSICLAVSIYFNIVLVNIELPPSNDLNVIYSFVTPWLFSYLPYLAASLLVLITPAPTQRWRWLELALIIVGALI